MKIIIAPNALKGSLSAVEAANIIEEGLRRVLPGAETVLLPVSDGGDGLLQIVETVLPCKRITQTVHGSLGNMISADFLYCASKKTVVIEMAQATGLALLQKNELNPMQASSYGFGELIHYALDLGVNKIILGIGGSASCDGGSGMLSALGVRFLDAEHRILEGNGANLEKIRCINTESLDARLSAVDILVLCDVTNPLLGDSGAARVYAPQKGASPTQVETLERGLANLADVIEETAGLDVRNISGAGAAGGLGAGLFAFLNAELKTGSEYLLKLINFERSLNGASLVLTAEGRLDAQSCYGKATAVVAQFAKRRQVPCYAIGGSIAATRDELLDLGFDAVFSLGDENRSEQECMRNASTLLANAAEQAMHYFLETK